ncbi:MAG: glycosyltransferase family 4 protein [Acidimicrobiia bacterium]
MRVGVNLLWCRTGRVGGSEEYLVRQLVGLAQCGAPDVEVALFAQPSLLAAHPDLSVGAAHASPEWGDARWRRIVGEHRWLPRAARGLDAMHHGGGTLPHRGRAATLLTVHDVQYLTYPRWFGATKLAYLRATVPSSVRRASRVAVPSAYVRDVIVERFGRDPREVHVVRHGLEPSLGAAPTPDPELRRRYGLGDGPYLVYPAITHPHKNHVLLLDLLAGPWRTSGVRVVFAGGAGRADADVVAGIAARGLADRVVRTGRVTPADRDGLVRGARALVFPSLYEGFGAPVLEAMALGTPVVTTGAAALGELAAGAAVVAEPTREAWAGALDEVERRRDHLVAAGRARAAAHTARASGEDLLAAYRALGAR